MEPEAIHDLTPAYALDALDSHEAAEFEQHLRHCERCRSELTDLQEVTASLAYAAPPAPLPGALRARILDQARAERTNVIPFPSRRSRTTWALAAAASVAAAAAIGLGIWAAILNNDLGAERSARSRAAEAIALVGAPGTAHVDLSGASGSLAVGTSGRAVLVISNLPQAPPGRTYEAWVIEGSKPSPAGLFLGGGTTVVPLTRLVNPGSQVAVTVERAAGAAMPTGTPLFSARLS
jgi:anti-sigma-K factor RskA